MAPGISNYDSQKIMSDLLTGPHLAMAVFCEKVLKENDGVMSFIRIVDRITFAMPSASATPPALPLFVVLMFKAGDAKGTFSISLRAIGPSGQQIGTIEMPVLFEGEDRGANVVLQLSFQPVEEGLHWFDVLVDGQRVTRIPLRALYQTISVTGAGPASG